LEAQNAGCRLIAQSADGTSVRLAWYLDKWSTEITGFDIKRKKNGGDWVLLNVRPIAISITQKKDLNSVVADANEARRIHDKLLKMEADGKVAETPESAILLRLNSDTGFIRDLNLITSIDYDMALITGFGYEDGALSGAGNYEYGLFVKGTDKQLATATFNYGIKENADVIREIKAKKIPRSNRLQIIWKADKTKASADQVIGYNIYKNDIRIGNHPWLASTEGDQDYVWTDSDAVTDNHYAISAVTALDIEGVEKQFTYNIADFPTEYKSADLENIVWQDKEMRTILKVTWNFPKSFEHFIKGFYVEKDRMPEGYKQLSDLLSPSARIFVPTTREFVDTTPITLKSYVRFRIVVLYNDETEITGNEKRFYYFPFVQPPRPQNLKAQCAKGDDKMLINLNWDPPTKEDTLTDYYQVYASDPITDKLYLEMGITPPIKINKYKYEIQYSQATRYEFCAQAVGINRVESGLSDTASVIAPSMALQAPDIKLLKQDSSMVIITWDYPDVLDLKGFRIFQNKNLVAGDFEVTKDKRTFKTPVLKSNCNYAFSIQAVSETGIVSEPSIPAYITVQPGVKSP